MFKKIILALVCLSATLGISAAKLTATLQSGDKVTPFYGANAFVEAYNAAVNGDIITLSPGEFAGATIEKSITVIGTYAFSEDLSKATQFSTPITVKEDNVILEGIRSTVLDGLVIGSVENLIVNRCYFNFIKDIAVHNNTIITDCYLGSFQAMLNSKNIVLRNCSIYYFFYKNKIENPALIEYCNITELQGYSSFLTHEIPYGIYRNCCLGFYKKGTSNAAPVLNLGAPSEFHNNCFYEIYESSSSSSYSKTWIYNYGSAVEDNNISSRAYNTTTSFPTNGSFEPFVKDGISYGPVNHKEYPAIPSITASEIDTQTDDEGNLHVKITATARD